MKKWVLLLLTAFSLFISVQAFAQLQGRGFGDVLKLTEDQRAKFHDIMKKTGQALLPIKLEEKKKRIELAEVYLDPNVTKETVEQKIEELAALKHQGTEIRVNAHFEMLSLLNPEQRQTFAQFTAMRLMHDDGKSGMCHHMHCQMHHGSMGKSMHHNEHKMPSSK